MSLHDEMTFDAATFSGRVRLFPLPNLVMFPHVMQPLHLFEPRYRQLFEDALAGDRLIAMSLLRPGWEDDYEGCPKVYDVACLGKIATHQRLSDGRYNLLLLGQKRIRLRRELPTGRLYREAAVDLMEDVYAYGAAGSRAVLQQKLVESFRTFVPKFCDAQDQLDELLGGEVPLPMLTDVIAYTLELPLQAKQRLLATADVDRRARTLLKYLERMADSSQLACAAAAGFPPAFSSN